MIQRFRRVTSRFPLRGNLPLVCECCNDNNNSGEEKMNSLIEKAVDEINSAPAGKNRYTYIIGNNGSGKSRVLRGIADKLLEEGNAESILCVANTLYDRFQNMKSERVTYLGLRNVSNAIFLTNIDRQLIVYLITFIIDGGSVSKLERILNYRFTISFPEKTDDLNKIIDGRALKSKSLDDALKKSEQKVVSGLMGQSHTLAKLTVNQCNALKKFMVLRPKEIYLAISTPHGSFHFGQLSSGEQSKILTAVKIFTHVKNGSVLLIDEPEMSFHLHWQLEFHHFMRKLLAGNKSVKVIIATHSPVVVSEAIKENDTNALIILEKEKNLTEMDYIDLNKMPGATYNSVMLDFFNTATYKSNSVEEEVARTITEMDIDGKGATAAESIEHLKKIKRHAKGLRDGEKIIDEAIRLITEFNRSSVASQDSQYDR